MSNATCNDGRFRDLLRSLERQGWLVGRTKRGHLRIVSPDGSQVVYTSGTPGDHRVYYNFRAKLRRAGANV